MIFMDLFKVNENIPQNFIKICWKVKKLWPCKSSPGRNFWEKPRDLYSRPRSRFDDLIQRIRTGYEKFRTFWDSTNTFHERNLSRSFQVTTKNMLRLPVFTPVETQSESKLLKVRMAERDQARRGVSFSRVTFLRGMPLDPPLARIRPATWGWRAL